MLAMAVSRGRFRTAHSVNVCRVRPWLCRPTGNVWQQLSYVQLVALHRVTDSMRILLKFSSVKHGRECTGQQLDRARSTGH